MLLKVLPPLQTRIAHLIDDGYTIQFTRLKGRYIVYIIIDFWEPCRRYDGDQVINNDHDSIDVNDHMTTGVGNTISIAVDNALFLVGH